MSLICVGIARSRETHERLVRAIDVDEATASKDLSANLRQSFGAKSGFRDRVSAIVGDKRLRSWLGNPEPGSDVLFINGNHFSSEPQIPTSFISAKLVSAIRNEQRERQDQDPFKGARVLTLWHFCAEHKHLNDPNAGPIGLLRSLLAQLPTPWPCFDPTIAGRLRNFDNSSVDDLKDTLVFLVEQLPPNVIVFCILDDITTLERQAWEEDAIKVVDALISVTNVRSQCVFKLLMTSPTKSRTLHRRVHEQKVMWVPERVTRPRENMEYLLKHDIPKQLRTSGDFVSHERGLG